MGYLFLIYIMILRNLKKIDVGIYFLIFILFLILIDIKVVKFLRMGYKYGLEIKNV